MGKMSRELFSDLEIPVISGLFRDHLWNPTLIDLASKDTALLTGFRDALRAQKLVRGEPLKAREKKWLRSLVPPYFATETVLAFLKALDRNDWEDDDYKKLKMANLLQYLLNAVRGQYLVSDTRLQLDPNNYEDYEWAVDEVATQLLVSPQAIEVFQRDQQALSSFAWSLEKLGELSRTRIGSSYQILDEPVLTAACLKQLSFHPYLLPSKFLELEGGHRLVAAGTWFKVTDSDVEYEDYVFALRFNQNGPIFSVVPDSYLSRPNYIVLTHA